MGHAKPALRRGRGVRRSKPRMTVSSPSPPATRRRVRSVFPWRLAPSPWAPAPQRRTAAGGLGRRDFGLLAPSFLVEAEALGDRVIDHADQLLVFRHHGTPLAQSV